MSEFTIKDSGQRRQFASGMMRDTSEGKTNFLSTRFGPMYRRWAEHLTKGRVKYPDVAPGRPNWTLAVTEGGVDEFLRAKESAARHFESWLVGMRDEDHAAALFANVDFAEAILEAHPEIPVGLGAVILPAPALRKADEWEADMEQPHLTDEEIAATTTLRVGGSRS